MKKLTSQATSILVQLALVAVTGIQHEVLRTEEEVSALLGGDDASARCGAHLEGSDRAIHRWLAGGYSAKLGEYPSFAQLNVGFDGSPPSICGGTIISERLILTAAHCLFDEEESVKLSSIQVLAGGVITNSGRAFFAREFCTPRKFHRDGWDYDVAVLVMGQAILFNNSSIQPACLPAEEVDPNHQAHVVGLGLTPKGYPQKLQVLPVKKADKCPLKVAPHAVCYSSNDAKYAGDNCSGDSGGPVYANIKGKQTVVAVVQGGKSRCKAKAGQMSETLSQQVLMDRLKAGRVLCTPLNGVPLPSCLSRFFPILTLAKELV